MSLLGSPCSPAECDMGALGSAGQVRLLGLGGRVHSEAALCCEALSEML